jgi:hypothetical protein
VVRGVRFVLLDSLALAASPAAAAGQPQHELMVADDAPRQAALDFVAAQAATNASAFHPALVGAHQLHSQYHMVMWAV